MDDRTVHDQELDDQEPLLDGPRTRFRRPTDYVVVVLIVVGALATGLTIWWRSDVRNTTLVTGPASVTTPAVPTVFPPSLAQVWQQPSSATPVPVVAGPTIVTADNGSVIGRDPLTGQQRWNYTRDLGLCTVSVAWQKVIAVYHKALNCSEVTELDQSTGQRGAQRNGDAQLGTQLITDGIYVSTTGPTLLDTWRYDLVQTMEYGTVPDFVNPNVQPRTGCDYGSVAAYGGEIGVIERCPTDLTDRLSLYRATATNADQPSVVFSDLTGAKNTRLVAFNDQYAAVLAPDPDRLIVLNAQNGTVVNTYPLSLPAQDLNGNPPGLVVPTTTDGNLMYWYTGSSTIALSATTFAPQWTVQNTLGSGTLFAGQYLVPVPGAIEVLNPSTGATVGSVGVNRNGYTGPVEMNTLGPMVFEQRGSILAALR